MDISFLLKGMLVGFAITAPIGPVGVLCINRTLSGGRMSGFFTGLGAVTADGFYSVVAAYGITTISAFLTGHQVWFRFAGGIFLTYLGIKIVLSKPAEKPLTGDKNNLLVDYVSTFLVTLTNPLTIIVFAAIFAGLGLGSAKNSFFSATMMVAGVVSGSALGWLTLSTFANVFREKKRSMQMFYKISGSIILIFGIVAFLSTLQR
ncbi:LysE family translocator [Candidatus Omnitrophota bacterium]